MFKGFSARFCGTEAIADPCKAGPAGQETIIHQMPCQTKYKSNPCPGKDFRIRYPEL
jgi:hypothetical protein